MKDTVLKRTGNSRYLKSVEDFKTLYPTYDDFAAALVAGTLPVDLLGLNSAGVEQTGTALNKANLLTDATAGLYGLDGTAVPNDVFGFLSNGAIPVVEADGGPSAGYQNNAFSGTSPRITELTAGTTIIVVPQARSYSTHYSGSPYSALTFNLNDLGAYPVMPFGQGVSSVVDFLEDGFFRKDVPTLMFFDGAAWRTIIGATRFQIGSYVGTGTYGSGGSCSVTIPFCPRFFSLYGYGTDIPTIFSPTDVKNLIIPCNEVVTNGWKSGYQPSVLSGESASGELQIIHYEGGPTALYWRNSSSAGAQNNTSGVTYCWFAIG